MLDERWVLLGACLSLLGSLGYARRTLLGRTRPHRVTWALWAAAPLIGLGAQLDAGVGWPAVLTLSIGVGPALILAASFLTPTGHWRVSRADQACGAVAAVALVVWLALDDPVAAVLLAVLADAVAAVPTIRKAWTHPGTEHPLVFALGGTNGVIALLTIDSWTAQTWLFPAWIACLGTSVAGIVLLRSRRLSPDGRARRAPG